MEKDIDRLVLENAIVRFLNSKSKEDAFDVFFCYLDMYVSDYTHIKKILDELSSYENDIYKQTEQNAGYYTDAVLYTGGSTSWPWMQVLPGYPEHSWQPYSRSCR